MYQNYIHKRFNLMFPTKTSPNNPLMKSIVLKTNNRTKHSDKITMKIFIYNFCVLLVSVQWISNKGFRAEKFPAELLEFHKQRRPLS